MFYNVPLSSIVIKHIRRRDADLDLWRHPDDVDKLLGGQEPYDFHTWIPGVFFATGEFALSQWPFRRTLSHCLIAAMFLSIALIFVSYFSCFVLSSWIFRLYIWPHVDFQIFDEKASNEPVKYIISLVFYISIAWMASRSCVSFRSSFHDAFVSVFRWLFLQYRNNNSCNYTFVLQRFVRNAKEWLDSTG